MARDEQLSELTRSWTLIIPTLSVLLAIMASALVPLVTTSLILPDLPLALLISWRLYRPDQLAPWIALPLGFANDLFLGLPVGISATVWPLTIFVLALIEPRFPLRDIRMDWLLAATLICLAALLNWQLLSITHYPLPLTPMLINIGVTILFFPLVARLAAWMERRWLVAG